MFREILWFCGIWWFLEVIGVDLGLEVKRIYRRLR